MRSAPGQEPVALLHRWEADPDIGSRWLMEQVESVRPIDVTRLTSPDEQHRVTEAQNAVLQSRLGTVENRKAALAAVLKRLDAGEGNRQVMLAMVSAAASLAAGPQDASAIWESIGDDSIARKTIEPWLVRWGSDVALQAWRERIAKEGGLPHEMIVALRGIGATGDTSDRPGLEALIRQPTSLLTVRFAAAEALGKLVDSGLEELSQDVLHSPWAQRELIAARLLAGHSSAKSEETLVELTRCNNTAAQTCAFQIIAANFPERARKLIEPMLVHSDSQTRLIGVHVLDQFDDEASLNQQALVLSDPIPRVRRAVRENLERKARDEKLRSTVDEIAMHYLRGEAWQGTEQAILLVVALDDARRAPILAQLLEHPKPEIFVRAAWGLQALELQPEVLEQIVAHCQVATGRLENQEVLTFEEIVRIAFCFEAIGRHAYQPADEMLQKYVPKNDHLMRDLTRTSAIYALGHIWEDRPNPALTKELGRRLLDNNPLDPEAITVQYVSAIAMGRIGDRAAMKDLTRAEQYEPTMRACDWAIERLGGKSKD